jgi:hypothetical protein
MQTIRFQAAKQTVEIGVAGPSDFYAHRPALSSPASGAEYFMPIRKSSLFLAY